MRQFIATISLLSLIVLPILSVADTIVLKSGRKIDATTCWEDGDLVKCKVYGRVIGYLKRDIAEIKMDAASVMPTKGFRYDIWQSGAVLEKKIVLDSIKGDMTLEPISNNRHDIVGYLIGMPQ